MSDDNIKRLSWCERHPAACGAAQRVSGAARGLREGAQQFAGALRQEKDHVYHRAGEVGERYAPHLTEHVRDARERKVRRQNYDRLRSRARDQRVTEKDYAYAKAREEYKEAEYCAANPQSYRCHAKGDEAFLLKDREEKRNAVFLAQREAHYAHEGKRNYGRYGKKGWLRTNFRKARHAAGDATLGAGHVISSIGAGMGVEKPDHYYNKRYSKRYKSYKGERRHVMDPVQTRPARGRATDVMQSVDSHMDRLLR